MTVLERVVGLVPAAAFHVVFASPGRRAWRGLRRARGRSGLLRGSIGDRARRLSRTLRVRPGVLVEGDPDKDVALIGVVGQLRLEVEEAG